MENGDHEPRDPRHRRGSGDHNADTFFEDLHKTEKFDFILANPPFNLKDWGGKKLENDVRWQYGTPPEGNANFAWSST